MWNTRLDEAQAVIRIAGRNISNLRYTNNAILIGESEEELKSLLIKLKGESEKVGLKFNIQNWSHLVPSLHGNRWGNNGKSERLYFGGEGSKITSDGDCSHEIKRRLLLGGKAMTNLHSILKSRDITLPTKVHLVKAMVFPEVMYRCESWTIKKAQHQRIDAFELWCWIRLLRVPWTARRSNQSWLKESVLNIHWKDWCWSRNSNTLVTWCK